MAVLGYGTLETVHELTCVSEKHEAERQPSKPDPDSLMMVLECETLEIVHNLALTVRSREAGLGLS